MNEQSLSSVDNQAQAIAKLPPDLAILKLENDSIQALAAARPRDMEAIKSEIESQLKAFPVLAEKAIYRKPVGKDPETGRMKFAEGLSVRAAEAIAEVYGYNRVRVDVSQIDDNAVKVEATFTDYQRGRIWQDAGIVSKFYKDRYGKTSRIPDDRFYGVVVKAESSRRAREVVMRSVNPGLKAWFEDCCRKVAASKLTDADVAKMIAKFGGIGVKPEHIEGFLGKPLSVGLTQQDRLDLLGIWNAIEEKETTIFEAFDIERPNAGPKQPETPATGAGGDVTAAAFEAPKAAETKPKEPSQPSQPATSTAEEPATVPMTPPAETKAAGETKPASPTAAVFNALVERLDQCTTVGDVTKLYGEAVSAGFSEDEAYRFEALAEGRKQTIRDSKAEAKGKGKELKGALVA